ncbi:MAG: hypothetical protein M1834_009091 [Cirrosporium novae-zelandiae]|nr:MAG: hypothetical protein M1834_009091 [Cirrosporium novae-zelandiae]
MVFYPPDWVPQLEDDPPDTVPLCDFMFNEIYGRYPLGYSRSPFTCGLSGREYSALELRERVDYLARALSKEFGWMPNKGTEWDKVVGVYALNTVDTLALAWATHRLNGICSPVNAAYSVSELSFQLKDSGSKVVFTCLPLLGTALEAASKVGIPKDRVYLLDLPLEFLDGKQSPHGFKTVNQLIKEGEDLPRLESLKWTRGQGARQVAFLCYSSGTSGFPKGVMISHRNVLANVLQMKAYERDYRNTLRQPGTESDYIETVLGLLPQSHIYSLVVMCHLAPYRGDQIIVLPKFEMKSYLEAIQRFKINMLYIVPPMVIQMVKNKKLLDQYNLSSVRSLYTGAAPLGKETAEVVQAQYPKWTILQAYGLTETSTVVCSTSPTDVWLGSSGSLMPSCFARLVSLEGVEITGYDQPGELLVQSPSVVLGYLHDDEANRETFQDGWMRTGDEVVIKKGPNGHEHLFIVDRIKELIKVKGMQVPPAELEAQILTHPSVSDCAVIPIHSDTAGEVPKAFIVKSTSVGLEENEMLLKRNIMKHVQDHKARHKWVKEIEFVDVIPKSASGKILRRILKDKERQNKRKEGGKL